MTGRVLLRLRDSTFGHSTGLTPFQGWTWSLLNQMRGLSAMGLFCCQTDCRANAKSSSLQENGAPHSIAMQAPRMTKIGRTDLQHNAETSR